MQFSCLCLCNADHFDRVAVAQRMNPGKKTAAESVSLFDFERNALTSIERSPTSRELDPPGKIRIRGHVQWLVVLLLVCDLALSAQAAERHETGSKPKRVLVVHSFGNSHPLHWNGSTAFTSRCAREKRRFHWGKF